MKVNVLRHQCRYLLIKTKNISNLIEVNSICKLNRKRVRLFVVLVLFGFVSCQKENLLTPDDVEGAMKNEPMERSAGLSSSVSDTTIVLGDSINDPYRYENMLVAFKNIYGKDSPTSSIMPNNKYVKILPTSQDEYNAITEDTTLLLFDFPLHYELSVKGVSYHDSSVDDTLFTWLYCVVPYNYSFPTGITEHKIYDVFIPPTDPKDDFYDQLEEEAYRITGNLPEGQKGGNSWIPSATITAYDDVVGGYVPLENVKVSARYLTKVRYAYTNTNGYCSIGSSFKYSVDYAIKWETGYWDIRNGNFGQAYYNGPKLSSHWTLQIPKSGKSILYATVHRAANNFYYGNRLGLRKPNLSVGKTKIAVHNGHRWWGAGCCWGTWSLMGALPDIKIAHCPLDNTRAIFATTIHELAHQSHLLLIGKPTYVQIAKEIHESWANAVEWAMVNNNYRNDLSITNFNYTIYQDWYPENEGNGNTSCYTPLFIDLIDTYNQRGCGSIYPNDLISGYSISYVQNNILVHSYGLSSFKNSLKQHKLNGVTDTMIDQFMALYWNRNYVR